MFTCPSQDVSLLDLSDYRHDGVNISSFQLINPTNPLVEEVINDWVMQQVNNEPTPLDRTNGLTVSHSDVISSRYF